MRHGSLVRPPDSATVPGPKVASRLSGAVASRCLANPAFHVSTHHRKGLHPRKCLLFTAKGFAPIQGCNAAAACTTTKDNSKAHESHPAFLGLLQGFPNDFVLGEPLGKGGFGTVYLSACKYDGVAYATKVIPKRRNGACQLNKIEREVTLWTTVQGHTQCVARLHRAYEDQENVYLVQELCRGGTLLDKMKSNTRFSEVECARVCAAVLEVVSSCHRQDVCYGDVKPANVMFTEPYHARGSVKVVDFGCSQKCAKGTMLSQFTGTPRYMAPEIYLRSYGLQSDLWGVGTIMYEMLCGSHPLYESNPDGSDPTKYQWTKCLLSKPLSFKEFAWKNVSTEAIDLIQQMLNRDSKSRISAEAAMQHPWFASALLPLEVARALSCDGNAISKEMSWRTVPAFA